VEGVVEQLNHAKHTRGRERFFSAFLILLVPAVCLVAGEYFVRILAPQQIVSDILLMDPAVDFRLRPNAKGHMTDLEYSVSINVNSLGFRGREFSLDKPSGVKRVLFLGDSYVFGHGVEDDQTLPFRVGLELDRIMPGAFEVINGGVGGYCTANEVDFFMEYGLPLKPDLVVIQVMLHDVFDNKAWYEISSDGELKKRNKRSQFTESRKITNYIPGANWLRANSHLFKFVGVIVFPILTAGTQATQDELNEPSLAHNDPQKLAFYEDPRGHFAVTNALLRKLAKAANGIGAKSVLLTLGHRVPTTSQLLHHQLGQAAQQAGFAQALVLENILEKYTENERLFFPKDGHWTAPAIGFVALEVAKHIVKVSGSSSY
jgi:hypothetical protein